MATATTTELRLREIEPADTAAAAQIVYRAFARIHDRHRFPRDFPTLGAATALTSSFVAHPSIWGVVAEVDGRVVGSNFVDERGPIRGVGPITVDPDAQAQGVGRRLMEAALERSSGAAGTRLLQDSFNVASLSLYASLGFEVREPVALMAGTPHSEPVDRVEVRRLEERDIEAAEALSLRVHGYQRTNELRDALASDGLEPVVALRADRVVAYASTLGFFPAAHAVAETEADMAALVAGSEGPVSFLLPTRQAELLRWSLDAGLRVLKPMTYMSIGQYRRPGGAWIPSVLL